MSGKQIEDLALERGRAVLSNLPNGNWRLFKGWSHGMCATVYAHCVRDFLGKCAKDAIAADEPPASDNPVTVNPWERPGVAGIRARWFPEDGRQYWGDTSVLMEADVRALLEAHDRLAVRLEEVAYLIDKLSTDRDQAKAEAAHAARQVQAFADERDQARAELRRLKEVSR